MLMCPGTNSIKKIKIQQTLTELNHVPGIVPRGPFGFIFKTTQQKLGIFVTILQTSNRAQRYLEVYLRSLEWSLVIIISLLPENAPLSLS